MTRHRLLLPAIVATFLLAAAGCSVGPIAAGIPVSGSSSAKFGPVRVNGLSNLCVGMPSAGRVKIEVDSTAGADPDNITYSIADDLGYRTGSLIGPVNHHFEATAGFYGPGQCPPLTITVWGCSNPCPAWESSSQTFNYRVSIVP